MKRYRPRQDSFTQNAKRRKSQQTNPLITADVIKYSIVPLGALDWLNVSKELNHVALQYLLEDPRVLEKSDTALYRAGTTCNIDMLNRLIHDNRYNCLYVDTLQLVKDNKARLVHFLNHKFFTQIESDDISEVLHAAVLNGWTDVVTQILDRCQDSVNILYSSVHAKKAPVETIRLIIHHPKIIFDTKRALRIAVRYGNVEVAKSIIENARVDIKQAIKFLHMDHNTFEFLLDNYIVPETSNTRLKKKLWSQIFKSHSVECLEMALNHLALDPSDDSNVALYEACKYSSTNMIELLLQDDRVTPTIKPSRRNPIVAAAKHQRKDIVDFLINHPKIDALWLNQALIFWAQKNHVNAVSFVVNTYSKFVTAKAKAEAMQSAIKHDYTDVIDVLFNK